ncbi:MAG TPA: hypothetical protein VNK04_15355 [Gemmataceae bacterium]|nr:hypothetical protein [Gemmataceae bacterium]
MNPIADLHREAMRLADEADHFRRQGDLQTAQERLRQAFERERRAAELSAPDHSYEPTRSVLHRSAATLALECGEYREAERLIAAALTGNPPDEIAEELRDLLGRVYFDRPPKARRPLRPQRPSS